MKVVADLKKTDFVENGTLDLYHYSNNFGNEETVTLKPEKAKSIKGTYSRNDYEKSEVPRIWFYLDPSQKEKFFESSKLYCAEVDAKEVYDITHDPDDVVSDFRKEAEHFTINKLLKHIAGWERVKKSDHEWQTELERVKEPIYDGIYYVAKGIPMVTWFKEIKVEQCNDEKNSK